MSATRRDNHGRIRAFTPWELDELNNVEENWLTIKSALKRILDSNPPSVEGLSFEELYSKVYLLVVLKHFNLLHDGLKNLLNDHLKNNILGELMKTPVTEFCENVVNAWRTFERRGLLIRDILLYLERDYVRGTCDNVRTLVRKAFLNKIIHDTHVRRRMIESFTFNYKSVKIKNGLVSFWKIFGMLITLEDAIFEDIFETTFWTKSQEYFANEVKFLLEGKCLLEYIQLAEEFYNLVIETLTQSRLEEVTKSRVIQIFLDELITRPLQNIGGARIQNSAGEDIQNVDQKVIQTFAAQVIQNFDGEAIENFAAKIIQNSSGEICQYGAKIIPSFSAEVIQILENKISSEIASLYTFCARVPVALKKLKECVRNYLFEKNKNKVVRSEKFFVQSILDMKKEIEESLISNEISKNIVDGCGFDYFLNCEENGPEYLSVYIDKKLKKYGKVCQDVLKLLFFLKGNKFEHYYKRDLTKRLLNKSLPVDVETKTIAELRKAANVDFSYKVDRMLNDVRISDSINEEFGEHVYNSEIDLKGIELNVQLLTSNIWPISSIVYKCTLPVGPRDAFESFSTFYRQKFNGRYLTLLPHLGRVDLEFRTRNRKYTIQVSTYQMMILDLFNEKVGIHFEAIESQTNIPRPHLIRALQAMSNGNESKKILKCEAEYPDVYFINENYYSKNSKVKIQNENKQNIERKIFEKTAEDGRKQEIDATIVRIMKRKKTQSHTNILVAVTQELARRFNPQTQVIKKCIEDLIERNYLTRSADDRKMYEYVQ